MIVGVDFGRLVKPGAGGDINLAAQNGFDPLLDRFLIKGNDAVQDAVIGHRHRILPLLLDRSKQRPDAAGAVEQAVFAMQMQMHKGGHLLTYNPIILESDWIFPFSQVLLGNSILI